MPELPEIRVLAHQMREALPGRKVSKVTVLQPKCLNVPVQEFQAALAGAQILDVSAHGKWIQVRTSSGWLLLCLGMGGEIRLTGRDHLPDKYRLVISFEDGECLAINFWWFGYAHYVRSLADHPMVSSLGPDFMRLSREEFMTLLRGRRAGTKSFLMDQKRIAGIGNVYVQDPLFRAGVHPLRTLNTLRDDELVSLWQALRETMQQSIELGGSQWEQDLFGKHGHWDDSFFRVAYREGKPCPACGTPVQKIKTGSTSTHICPTCQS